MNAKTSCLSKSNDDLDFGRGPRGVVWREVDEPTYVGIRYQKGVAGRWILTFSGGIRTKVTCLVINGAVLLGC